MDWKDWTEFFAIGGYGLLVWSAIGLVLAGIITEVLALRHSRSAVSTSAFGTNVLPGLNKATSTGTKS